MTERRRVTVNTVADAAGVSRQTVTNALLHPDRVRPDTLARVQAEIERLGYRPSAAARSLQANRAAAVGIELNALGADYHNALMTPFLAALSVEASTFGIHMVSFGSDSAEPALAGYGRMWAAQLVDAFVIADTHHGDPRPRWLDAQGIPYAAFGRVWDDPTFQHWVDVDGHAGTSMAVDHCRAAGYERIGFLGYAEGQSVVADDRRQGWRDSCLRHGYPLADVAGSCIDELDDAVEAAGPIIEAVGPGGAVVCASDVVAVGVLHAAQRHGLQVGSDLGIVGFDDSELARMHSLTSVAQPVRQVASEVLRLLSSQLAGAAAPTNGILLRPTLTVRRSTQRWVDPDRT